MHGYDVDAIIPVACRSQALLQQVREGDVASLRQRVRIAGIVARFRIVTTIWHQLVYLRHSRSAEMGD